MLKDYQKLSPQDKKSLIKKGEMVQNKFKFQSATFTDIFQSPPQTILPNTNTITSNSAAKLINVAKNTSVKSTVNKINRIQKTFSEKDKEGTKYIQTKIIPIPIQQINSFAHNQINKQFQYKDNANTDSYYQQLNETQRNKQINNITQYHIQKNKPTITRYFTNKKTAQTNNMNYTKYLTYGSTKNKIQPKNANPREQSPGSQFKSDVQSQISQSQFSQTKQSVTSYRSLNKKVIQSKPNNNKQQIQKANSVRSASVQQNFTSYKLDSKKKQKQQFITCQYNFQSKYYLFVCHSLSKIFSKCINESLKSIKYFSCQKQYKQKQVFKYTKILFNASKSIFERKSNKLKMQFLIALKRLTILEVRDLKNKRKLKSKTSFTSKHECYGLFFILARIFNELQHRSFNQVSRFSYFINIRNRRLMTVNRIFKKHKIQAFNALKTCYKKVIPQSNKICWILFTLIKNKLKNGFFFIFIQASRQKIFSIKQQITYQTDTIQLNKQKQYLIDILNQKTEKVRQQKIKNDELIQSFNLLSESQEHFIENAPVISFNQYKKISDLSMLFMSLKHKNSKQISQFVQKQESDIQKQTRFIQRNGWLRGEIAAYQQKEVIQSDKRKSLLNERKTLLSMIANYTQERYYWQYLQQTFQK